jgi:hypothetical protein
MKDAVLTVRLPRATRARIEALARTEGRSLSQQVERLVERALQVPARGAKAPVRPLGDALSGARVPDLAAFRAVRRDLSRSFGRRSRTA